MILTFKDLQNEVLRRIDEEGDTGTTLTIVKDLLNNANRNRAMQFAQEFLVYDATLVTEIGRQEYALHEEFMRPLYFRNRTTRRFLKEVPDRQVSEEGYDWNNDQGTSEFFTLWGRFQVKQQPSSASVLEIVSTSALDTGSDYNVLIRGEDQNGNIRAEVIAPTGTVEASTNNQYRKILQVTKSGPWNGTMTLSSNDNAIVNLELQDCELGKNYQYIYLLSSPTTAETIEYRFFRNPLPMKNDYDQPEIPPPFCELLVYDALIQLAGYNTELDSKALGVWADMQKRMEEALCANFIDGQSLQARVRFVRVYDQYEDEWVRF